MLCCGIPCGDMPGCGMPGGAMLGCGAGAPVAMFIDGGGAPIACDCTVGIGGAPPAISLARCVSAMSICDFSCSFWISCWIC